MKLKLLLFAASVSANSFEILKLNITSGGASFPEDVYFEWLSAYPLSESNKFRPVDVTMTYESINSGAGKQNLMEKKYDFCGSDAAVTDNEFEQSNGTFRSIPLIAGGPGIAYRHPLLTAEDGLILTREALVGIYNGTIDYWGHPAIADLNPKLANTTNNIIIVVRGDVSGTTEIVTRALASFDSNWKETHGFFSEPHKWPSRLNETNRFIQADSSEGLALEMTFRDYAIGYLELGHVSIFHLHVAGIVNSYGTVTYPESKTISSAIEDFKDANQNANYTNFYVELVNGPGEQSYPICGYSYAIMRTDHPESCTVLYEIMRYFDWAFKDSTAATLAKSLNYIQVPSEALAAAQRILRELKCSDGFAIYDNVEKNNPPYLTAWLVNLNEPLGAMTLSFAIICAFVLVSGIILAIFYRKWTIQRTKNTFTLNASILLSLLVATAQFYLMLGVPTKYTCQFDALILPVACSFYFSILGLKAYRILAVFNQGLQFKTRRLKDKYLVALAIAGTLPSILIVVIWILVDSPIPTIRPFNNPPTGFYWTCSSNSPALQSIMILLLIEYNAVLLFVDLMIAMKCQNLPNEWNETKSISFSVYNSVFVAILCQPLLISDYLDYNSKYVIKCIAVFYMILFNASSSFLFRLSIHFFRGDTSNNSEKEKNLELELKSCGHCGKPLTAATADEFKMAAPYAMNFTAASNLSKQIEKNAKNPGQNPF